MQTTTQTGIIRQGHWIRKRAQHLWFSPSHFMMIRLPQPMGVNSSLNLVLETVQTHATRPWPEKAAQDEDQKLKYDMALFVLSPYRTVVQRTKIR